MFDKILDIVATQGIGTGFMVICLMLIVGGFYYLHEEKKAERARVDKLLDEKETLHAEKMEMAQEMLDMANEYNKQMQNLTRETNNTITALMAMISALPKPKRD